MKQIFLFLFCVFTYTIHAQHSIFDIARKGSLSEAIELVSKYPDTINRKNDAGYSPLILACYNGNIEVASYLIENMKDINGSSSYGTPLMAAVVKNEIELVKLLLKKGADPNIKDTNGTTALIYATMFQYNEIVKILCKEATIVVEHKDNKGFTALDYANKIRNEELILIIKQKRS